MNVRQACKRDVTTIAADADVAEAARLMLDRHDTFVVVYAKDDSSHTPVGVVTDGDIVRGHVHGDAPTTRLVRDVMTREPITAREQDQLEDVLWMMQLTGLSRIAVVDARGRLTGVLALEDAQEYKIAHRANRARASSAAVQRVA